MLLARVDDVLDANTLSTLREVPTSSHPVSGIHIVEAELRVPSRKGALDRACHACEICGADLFVCCVDAAIGLRRALQYCR